MQSVESSPKRSLKLWTGRPSAPTLLEALRSVAAERAFLANGSGSVLRSSSVKVRLLEALAHLELDVVGEHARDLLPASIHSKCQHPFSSNESCSCASCQVGRVSALSMVIGYRQSSSQKQKTVMATRSKSQPE